ncbi:MAG: hypothetical protein KDD64_06640 [Bdellovibrionales bacterium]|nr:hypothetical protein [Bdellovibrionales bacterium]
MGRFFKRERCLFGLLLLASLPHLASFANAETSSFSLCSDSSKRYFFRELLGDLPQFPNTPAGSTVVSDVEVYDLNSRNEVAGSIEISPPNSSVRHIPFVWRSNQEGFLTFNRDLSNGIFYSHEGAFKLTDDRKIFGTILSDGTTVKPFFGYPTDTVADLEYFDSLEYLGVQTTRSGFTGADETGRYASWNYQTTNFTSSYRAALLDRTAGGVTHVPVSPTETARLNDVNRYGIAVGKIVDSSQHYTVDARAIMIDSSGEVTNLQQTYLPATAVRESSALEILDSGKILVLGINQSGTADLWIVDIQIGTARKVVSNYDSRFSVSFNDKEEIVFSTFSIRAYANVLLGDQSLRLEDITQLPAGRTISLNTAGAINNNSVIAGHFSEFDQDNHFLKEGAFILSKCRRPGGGRIEPVGSAIGIEPFELP